MTQDDSQSPPTSLIDKLKAQLIRDEREVLHAYQDSEGYWTIGVGRLIDVRKGGGITHQESDFLLENDIATKMGGLISKIPWIVNLDEARQGVLYNMAFNLGVPGLLEFKMTLSLIEGGNYAEAAEEMLKSKWATQVGDRALRLSKQMATGEWV